MLRHKYRAQTQGGKKAMKDAERRALAEDSARVAEALAATSDELAALTVLAGKLADRGGPVSLLRLPFVLSRGDRVRARGTALKARLEEIVRREVALFEATRLEAGRRWGLGVENICSSWPHLEAWERWFRDADERLWWEITAEKRGGYPARREEISRQVEDYGIHDHARWVPDLDVLPRH